MLVAMGRQSAARNFPFLSTFSTIGNNRKRTDMTTIKDALKAFEAKTGEVAVDSTKVLLYGQFPPIQKMDIALGGLKNCEQLSISSNNIDRISGLKGMEKLKILSLGRNLLKALQGLEDVADTLEEIWVSYNSIDKLAGLEACTKLKVLYMANNLIKDWKEIDRLKSCVQLEELLLVGNPIVEASGDQFRIQVAGRLPWLKKLDGNPVDEEERELGRAAVPQ